MMTRSRTTLSAVMAVFPLFSSVAVAEFRLHEELLLVDCGIGTLPDPGHSSSRWMAYYANGFHSHNFDGGDWVQPDMKVEVPWDGSYPWRSSGVSARTSNGDLWQVWIDQSVDDYGESRKNAGRATHTYDGTELQCYGVHGFETFNLDDGTACTTAYVCWHDPKDSPGPKTSSDFSMSSEVETVRNQGTNAELESWDPLKAFGNIQDAIEGLKCKDRSYDIGSDCSISFDCVFGIRGKTEELSRVLTDSVAPAVKQTKKRKTGHYNGHCSPDGGFCEPGYDFEYYTYDYPHDGIVVLSSVGSDGSQATQSWIEWTVSCSGDGFCGSFCTDFNQIMVDGIASIAGFPPVTSIACSLC